MDAGDLVSSAIAAVSLTATAILAYRLTRLQARLTSIEAARPREEVEARQRADVRAMVAGTPTALQLVLANDGPATAWEVWATELPVGSDDPPLFHGLDVLEQTPATLRPGDRLPFPGPDAGRDGRPRAGGGVVEGRGRPPQRVVHGAVAIGTSRPRCTRARSVLPKLSSPTSSPRRNPRAPGTGPGGRRGTASPGSRRRPPTAEPDGCPDRLRVL